ncbi:hypothetical protein EI94DRAFT_1702880 [Lactarius quietus]|nr:hypothetical protein EI94DRAFT_1702880 [Lactarius quietus]
MHTPVAQLVDPLQCHSTTIKKEENAKPGRWTSAVGEDRVEQDAVRLGNSRESHWKRRKKKGGRDSIGEDTSIVRAVELLMLSESMAGGIQEAEKGKEERPRNATRLEGDAEAEAPSGVELAFESDSWH